MKLEFSRQTFEKYFMKICPVGAKLFHAGQTKMTELTDALRNFANMPKNGHLVCRLTRGL